MKPNQDWLDEEKRAMDLIDMRDEPRPKNKLEQWDALYAPPELEDEEEPLPESPKEGE